MRKLEMKIVTVLLLSLCMFTVILDAMENVPHQLHGDYTNKIILDYDGNANTACYMAKTASIVHSDSNGMRLDEILSLQKKHAKAKNLTFTQPQSKFYDIVTIFNSSILRKETMLSQLANHVKDYLKDNGEIHALVTTQNNCFSIESEAILMIFPRIYECLSLEMKQELKEEWQIDSFAQKFKLHFCTDEEIKDHIWTAGYKILSYEEIVCENVVKIGEMKRMLKSDFFKFVQGCEFSKELENSLWKEFRALILNKYKKNDNGDVIFPFKATKIHLLNEGPMRFRLNMNLNNYGWEFNTK